uniref:LIM zinc-binding domain-containing protein n=1 Tax=Ditylenchus dipsaci TaxID=166011 RepID=A0A915CL39_9BILA
MFGTAQDAPPKRCSICGQVVALADKLVVEQETIHKDCFKCSYCELPLKPGDCAQELSFHSRYGPRWYCKRLSSASDCVCIQQTITAKETRLREMGVQVRNPKGRKWIVVHH